jgi:cephalosporin hydroxylase
MLKKDALELLQKNLWIDPEISEILYQKIRLGELNESVLEKLISLLASDQKDQEINQAEFFRNHPELKIIFSEKLNHIQKHLLQEIETFDRTQTEAQIITDLESDLSSV